jgi:hypothetical protein
MKLWPACTQTHDDDRVSGVTLGLWTAATNGHFVPHPGDIYERGEPWWNDIDRGKLLIRSTQLSGNPNSSYLVAKQEELTNEMIFVSLWSRLSLSYFEGFFNMPYMARHGDDEITSPPKESVLRILIALKKSIVLGRRWTRKHSVQWQVR